MWYDVRKTLSYNCLFNFVIGNRGCGKTYSCKKWAVDDYLKNGNEFIYLRRYDSELDLVKKSLFNDLCLNDQRELEIEYAQGNEYRLNEQTFGYCMPLSISQDFKSSSYPKVNKIIFDEFIIDKGYKHYIKNEVELFLDFYETVARMRDVTVIFLSNAISFYNPYTVYFDLKLPFNKNIVTKNDILLQLVSDEDYINTKNQTRFAKLTAGTKYADYAINNNFLRDDDSFIAKKTGRCDCSFIFTYQTGTYGVWFNYDAGLIYVSQDYDPSCRLKYAFTLDDHGSNTTLIKTTRNGYLRTFIRNYQLGNVRFENQRVKNVTYDIIRSLIM